jgi:FtsP/CotA-like multicopper oxidase with cupredoxin domain
MHGDSVSRGGALSIAAVLLLACGASPAVDEPAASQGPDLRLAEAPDLDPDPDIVRVELVAAPTDVSVVAAGPSRVATFGGTLPGPLIRARRGNRVVALLGNEMSEPTTLHFHGIRLPNVMDGVPGETQTEVLPGETFTYDFVAPDAGLYWYHPHYASLRQVGSGLYGPLLIDDPDEPALGDEVVLVLSDLSVEPDGSVAPEVVDDATIVAGREGNVVLVNGLVQPELTIVPERRLRLRLLNAARSRYFRLGLADHEFLQIGSDGGRLESPVAVREPVVAPGERLDLLLEPRSDAAPTLELMALPFSRGIPLPASRAERLVTLRFGERGYEPSPTLPSLERDLSPIETAGATPVPLTLTVGIETSPVVMGINGVPFAAGDAIHAQVGETQVIEIKNESPLAHPFHLHGFFFQPVDENGATRHPIMLKDTIDVPPLAVERVAVKYDDRPGMWMFHCHILDHAEVGMMGMMHVMP